MQQFEAFHAWASEQEVVLPPAIVDTANDPYRLGKYCFAANDMLAAIAQTGQQLRVHPGVPLIDKPLPTEGGPHGTAADILRTMLNASLVPYTEDATPSFTYTRPAPTISTCSTAEKKMGMVLRYIMNPVQAQHTPAQIITAEGKPLFVRKLLGHPSAINLRKIIMNGVPYAPGGLFRVDTVYDTPIPPLTAADRLDWADAPPEELRGNALPSEYTTCDISDVTAVGFSRLSTFALPPDEREYAMFIGLSVTEALGNPELEHFLHTSPLHEIANAIKQALPLARKMASSARSRRRRALLRLTAQRQRPADDRHHSES